MKRAIIFLFLLLANFIPIASCAKDSKNKQTHPVTVRFLHNADGLTPQTQTGVFGPRKVEVSITAVFVTGKQVHYFYDKNTKIVGQLEIFQPECNKNITIKIPENYFVAQRPPQLKTINPCGLRSATSFKVDSSKIKVLRSKALKDRNYHALNVYPEIPEGEPISMEINIRLRPVPGLFF